MDPGIEQVAQYEVHDPIAPAEGYGGFRVFGGQRVKALAFTACHDNCKDSRRGHE